MNWYVLDMERPLSIVAMPPTVSEALVKASALTLGRLVTTPQMIRPKVFATPMVDSSHCARFMSIPAVCALSLIKAKTEKFTDFWTLINVEYLLYFECNLQGYLSGPSSPFFPCGVP